MTAGPETPIPVETTSPAAADRASRLAPSVEVARLESGPTQASVKRTAVRAVAAFAGAAATTFALIADRPLSVAERVFLKGGDAFASIVGATLGAGDAVLPLRSFGAASIGLLAAAVVVLAARIGRRDPSWRASTAAAFACALQAPLLGAASNAAAVAFGALAAVAIATFAAAVPLLRRTPLGAAAVFGVVAILGAVAFVGADVAKTRAADVAALLFARRPDAALRDWATPVVGLALMLFAGPPRSMSRVVLVAGASLLSLAAAAVLCENAAAAVLLSSGIALAATLVVGAISNFGRAAVFVAGFAAFAAAHAGATSAAAAEEERVESEWRRFADRIHELLPPRDAEGDVVVGLPETAERPFQSALPSLRTPPLLADLAHVAAIPPKRLRVARYGPPLASGYGSNLPAESTLAFDALVDKTIHLESPAAGTTLSGMLPQDEPEFVFSLPLAADPGATSHLFTAVLFTTEPDGRVRTRGVPLDASLASRTEVDGRARYLWRPSWRSDSHVNAELAIEHEELGAAGTTTWWTILVGAPHSGICAIAAPAEKPRPDIDPRRAAMFRRPTTCAVPSSFALPRR
jgi:hypothetical protein